MQLGSLEVLAEASPDLPFSVNQDPENTGIDTILDNRMIALRNPRSSPFSDCRLLWCSTLQTS